MKKTVFNMDLGVLTSIAVLYGMGSLAIYSAGFARGTEGLAVRQLIWFISGIGVMFLTRYFPVKNLLSVSNALYIVLLILLVLVLVFGSTKMGAKRWLEFGGFQFQPSETGKFALICVLSRFYSEGKIRWEDKKNIITGLVITSIPAFLLLRQPDLGSAAVYFFIFFSIIFAAGLPTRYIFNASALTVFVFIKGVGAQYFITALILYGIILNRLYFRKIYMAALLSCAFITAFASEFFWKNLKTYQQVRLMTFINPEKFSTEGGWQIVQSKTAVYNGGFSGSGFMNGSQTQLRFLPEGHNDFIFSVIAEEFGLIGITVLLLAFYFLFFRLIRIAGKTASRFLYLAGTGIVSLLIIQTAMNIFVTLGLLPVTGLTLPFVSYGGTALMINMFMVGMVMSMGSQMKTI